MAEVDHKEIVDKSKEIVKQHQERIESINSEIEFRKSLVKDLENLIDYQIKIMNKSLAHINPYVPKFTFINRKLNNSAKIVELELDYLYELLRIEKRPLCIQEVCDLLNSRTETHRLVNRTYNISSFTNLLGKYINGDNRFLKEKISNFNEHPFKARFVYKLKETEDEKDSSNSTYIQQQ